MTNVNWCTLPKDAEDETSPQRTPVSDKFLKLVHAISRKTRVRMLDRETENTLLRSWNDDGDRAALEKLLNCFDPMIMTMARNTAERHGCLHITEDVYQTGQEAFIKSLPRYRIEDGNRLSTFVKYGVAGEMIRICMDLKMPMPIGKSAGERIAYYQYRATMDAFKACEGRKATSSPADLAVISKSLGVAPKAFQRAEAAIKSRTVPYDRIALWSEVDTHDDIDKVRGVILAEFKALSEVMSPRNFDIATAALSGASTLECIAAKNTLTIERIRQIRREALRILRENLQARGIHGSTDLMTQAA
jgi:DNA-directed RNA polymerase specialized sigma subunit